MTTAREPEQDQEIRLEALPECPVCGGPGTPHHRDLADRLCHVPGRWNFHRCLASGNLWLNPRPIEADLGLCYPGAYFTHSSQPTSVRRRRQRPPGVKERLRRKVLAAAYGYNHLHSGGPAARTLTRVLALLPPVRWEATHHLGACLPIYRQGGRLLDVGCGNGRYLARMREYGWEVAGIEVDDAAAEVARQEYGLTVHGGAVESAPFPPGSFDVITCQHVLEHIARPRPFLAGMSHLLRPGGRLIVVTPNAASLGHRWFQRDCYSLDPPRHLVVHTIGSLRLLVQQVPDLQLASARTHSRIARKIFLQGQVLRRYGAFRAAEATSTALDRLGALLFGYAEALGCTVLPLGEELELVAIRVD